MMLTIAYDPTDGRQSFTFALERDDGMRFANCHSANYSTTLPAISDFLMALAAIAKTIETREPGEYPKNFTFDLGIPNAIGT